MQKRKIKKGKTMQIVIEIPKECIPTKQDIMDIQLHFVDRKVVEASGYGFAVLPEHGRLIDVNEYFNGYYNDAREFLDKATTILEATKGNI